MRRPVSSRDVELVWSGKGAIRAPSRGPEARAQLETLERVPGIGRSAPRGRGAGPNRLLLGDNLAALGALRARLAGRVDLVVVDLPFASGSDYRAPLRLEGGAAGTRRGHVAYRDRWGAGLSGYLSMLAPRLELLHALLGERGSLYVHVDQRASAVVRLLLEEIFGPGCFVNELVWAYRTGGTPARLGFSRKHDTLLFFAKDPARALWNPQREQSRLRHRYGFRNVEILEDEQGPYTWVKCRDVLEIPALRGNQPERVDYPTQKPEALVERLVLASSDPGSLVVDAFCGSGTTLVVAERLGRRWIGCDSSPLAVAVARKRLLALAERAPFEIVEARSRVEAPTQAGPRLRARPIVEGRSLRIELRGLDLTADDPLAASEASAAASGVDAWSVGWHCPDGIAVADWTAWRERGRRDLPLISAPHRYPRRGAVRPLVTAIDALGRRATLALNVELDG